MKIKKNLAAILTGQKKSLSIYNISIPEILEGYVLVKMKYSGICHTQLNEIDGILGKDNFLPHCIGHEGVGEIIEKGKNVKKLNSIGLIYFKKLRLNYTLRINNSLHQ